MRKQQKRSNPRKLRAQQKQKCCTCEQNHYIEALADIQPPRAGDT